MTKFTEPEITKLLDTMIGPTDAYGDSAVDSEHLENLRLLIDVTNWCLDGLMWASGTRHRPEHSMREIGETAFSALMEIRQWIKDITKEGDADVQT